jgi:adenylate kinase family enzyme
MQRISVVGTSGSGKTTLSRAIGERLGLPHIELDALYWGPNWTAPSDEDFRARVREAVAAERWVCDGNYSLARDIVQPRADTLIWLDLPFPLVLGRTVRRTVGRAISREPMWNGNIERWRQVVSRDGLIWWVITTHRSRRRRWEEWLRRPDAAQLRVIRLRSRTAIDRWLASIPGPAPG